MKSSQRTDSLFQKTFFHSQRLSYFALILIIGLGSVLTGILYNSEGGEEQRWLKEKFHEEARNLFSELQKTIVSCLDDVETLTACYRASQQLTRQEFNILATQLLSRNPCLQALEWLQRVPDSERAAWAARIKSEGFPNFQITERGRQDRMAPAARRPEYYVISYVTPYRGNEAAMGYDPSSEATRRIALYKSRDTGALISSDWVNLVQGKDSEYGIILSSPVYRNELPAGTTGQRRQAIQGFVVAVVKIQSIIKAAWGDKKNPGLDIHLADLSAYSEARMHQAVHFLDIGHDEAWTSNVLKTAPGKPAIEETRILNVADHAWQVGFTPLPAFFKKYQKNASQKTLWIGLTTTLLLAIYLHFLLNRAEHARRHAAEMGRSQAELEESRERFAGIIAMASDAILCLDEQKRIIIFNKGAEKSFGYPADEVIGRPIGLLLPGCLAPREAGAAETVPECDCTAPETGRMVYGLRKDGKEFPAEASISRLKMGGARILTLILRDRSEKELLESQLRHVQKMDAVGQLAGGVAHDFNNILTVILGNASVLMNELKPDHQYYEQVEAILDASTRAAAVTRQLLAFSRKQTLQTRVINLNAAINEMHKVLKRLIREDIQVSTLLGSDLWMVRADPCQIDQVIVNLVVNARDAMPDGGELCIETCNVTLAQHLNTLHGALDAGEYVLLTVRDRGVGMDESTLTRIFEPFFTTKQAGQGTGLGLATVYAIMKQLGGMITVESKPGQGTAFRLYFPRTEGLEAANDGSPEAAPDAPRPCARPRTVLVVEDDDLLRNFILNALQRWGYAAQAVASGPEALENLRAKRGRVDLLLTDVVMPGLSGAELAAQVAQAYPAIKILFMSGYPRDGQGKRLLSVGEADFLAKPFTARELVERIRQILEPQECPET